MSQNETAAPEGTDATSSRRPRLSRGTVRLLAVGLLVAVAAVGLPMVLHALSHESTDDAFVEAHVVPMSARVAGHVARVLVGDNEPVAAGQLLVEIDPRDYQAALDAARAGEQAAVAAVAEARAQAGAARTRLDQARADLNAQQAARAGYKADMDEDKAEFVRDAADLERIRALAETGVVSPQRFDHATAARDVSRAKLTSASRQIATQAARVQQARAALATAREALRQAEAQVSARRAEQQRAAAQLEQARLNLSYTRVTAPCDGTVAKKAVEPGAFVQPGQGLMSVVGDEVWVVANFKETQITEMRPGQPVAIEVDAYPDVEFKGHVDSIQRGTGSRFSLLPAENATGNFVKVVQRVPVKIVFDEDAQTRSHLLAPGMSVIPGVDITAQGRDAGTESAQAAPKTGRM